MICDYQGYEFGANYPDSICIDGLLWDADSGYSSPDGEGWCYTSGGELPCPACQFKAAVSRLASDLRFDAKRTPRNYKLFYNRARRRIRAYFERHGLETAR